MGVGSEERQGGGRIGMGTSKLSGVVQYAGDKHNIHGDDEHVRD